MSEFIGYDTWRKYQNTLELIMCYCVNELNPEIKLNVVGSFNKGLYFKASKPLFEQEVSKLKGMMEFVISCGTEIVNDSNQSTINGFTRSFINGCFDNAANANLFDLRLFEEGLLLTYPHYLEPKKLPVDNQKKLCEMFEKADALANNNSCEAVEKLNELVANGKLNELIEVQENLHEDSFKVLADSIKESGKRIVLICGPSSSGKTSFAKRLCEHLESLKLQTLYMGTDDYYVEKEEMPLGDDGQNDYECIEAIDVDLFQKNVKELINGEVADMPVFNFETMHKEYGKNFKGITSDTILVIEGILTLNKKLTSTISEEDKYKIYISPVSCVKATNLDRLSNTDIRLMRRICRDYRARNTRVERTIELWSKVRKGEEKNIFPFIDEADAVFNTYCIYEGSVLGKYIIPLLEGVSEDSEYYKEAQRLLKTANLFTLASDEAINGIYNKSIIREFIGGSVLVD